MSKIERDKDDFKDKRFSKAKGDWVLKQMIVSIIKKKSFVK